MIVDYRKYKLFEYEQTAPTDKDSFVLGEVVIKKDTPEIGVIIQRHTHVEYRTDMFGNCCDSEIRTAKFWEIEKYRPEIL